MKFHVECFCAQISPNLLPGRQTLALTATRIGYSGYKHTHIPFNRLYSSYNYGIIDHFSDKIARRLDTNILNPIGITTQIIKDFFASNGKISCMNKRFEYVPFESHPISITDNFDELQVPLNHVSRSPRDTYYLSQRYISDYYELKAGKYADFSRDTMDGYFDRKKIDDMGEEFNHSSYKVLPTHTTAHLPGLLRRGMTHAIYSGQVFRRDEIDSQHYPIFHQMDGFLLFSRDELEILRGQYGFDSDTNCEDILMTHLKNTLDDLVNYLFGFVRTTDKDPFDIHTYHTGSHKVSTEMTKYAVNIEKKWDSTAYFPFTHPSLELYIKNKGEWIEILGCGILKNIIIDNNFNDKDDSSLKNYIVGGWAFGIGLERLAMTLCDITDIRQFWETDPRFYRQYEGAYEKRYLPIFKKYSKNPPVIRDISFYLPNTNDKSFDESQFYTMVRKIGKDYIESIEFVSDYYNQNIKKKSLCYRVTYRGFGENITNEFVNTIHKSVENDLVSQFNVELR
ncbi:phenylalanine-tRNA synthetase, putative [Theileria equi strain WA]|uniref:phenylalanine--tRNA ligase n=1 Tax=Theileria equi strain WA TaxID=1537102 RepID=L0AUX6_THEEQ|nr:phenylalanine-tRNA synthetase, putative [Theileria equi strain WA]AFZ79043.1 phenylalanine-tRNA synthetase, putative [Theileria equi strain WA]|eukprot:XP_004828709.1 phenylalanine-tRNA synthetase, putative [Theileria equi strain WA]